MNDSTRSFLSSSTAWFYEEVPTASGHRVPYFLTQLSTFWPDLEDTRNAHMNTEEGLVNTMAFWEHPLRHEAPDIAWPIGGVFPEVLFEPQDGVEQDAVLPVTKGMVGAVRVRPDMADFETRTRLGRLRLVHWRASLGCREYRYLSLTDAEIQHLEAPSTAFQGAINHLPRLAELLPVHCADRPDWVALLNQGDVATYDALWNTIGPELRHMLANAARRPPRTTVDPHRTLGTTEPNGINIIGFATGQFGIGEDARTATRAFLKAGVAPCVYEPPIPLACAVIKDGWVNRYIEPSPRYRFNLFTIPAPDTLRMFFLQQIGVLAGRYNICAWQWELPHWPERWKRLLTIPDEIWAQSRYVQTMFEQVTQKPVVYMPLAVEVPEFSPCRRSRFGIPEEPFTFLSVFDCNSWFQRKNPMGAIRAFQAAFPLGNKDAQLVVKMMNTQREVPEYKELMRAVALDARVFVIDEFLSRNDMLALLDCADVFVSLHRSEGFGRLVAESMLQGKPVISTNYSGSVDFAHERTAYVVNGPLVPLKKGDYSEWEGQHWMEPDIGLAAAAMRRCIEDPSGTAAMALRGQQIVLNNHSIEAVSKRYVKRLRELGAIAG